MSRLVKKQRLQDAAHEQGSTRSAGGADDGPLPADVPVQGWAGSTLRAASSSQGSTSPIAAAPTQGTAGSSAHAPTQGGQAFIAAAPSQGNAPWRDWARHIREQALPCRQRMGRQRRKIRVVELCSSLRTASESLHAVGLFDVETVVSADP